MKVAIVHDYIKEYGGAERVLESLHSVFPDAPVFTTVYLPDFLGPHKERFADWKIKTSWAQILPFKAKLISPLRLIAPWLFASFNFSKFDVIIVSTTGAYSPNGIKKKNAKQFSYVHTPPRYLYGYETARDWKSNIVSKIIGTLVVHWLRMVDFKTSENVDFFIANSEETRKRIEKFYRKDSTVIYPPVEVRLPKTKVRKGNYYIAGGRIARAKHTDLIVDTFIKNGLPLKIFGKGIAGFEEEIKAKIAEHKNIEFLGEISDERKNVMMAGAKGFVFASKDEDFGIIPVESMMAGTPVIAQRSGGPLETIIEGETGLFFDEFSVESLNNAIRKFEKIKFDSKKIAEYAQKFNRSRFEQEIKEFVEKHA